jgi:NTP pyrophosphatase (non-canonical NTP hydrolase)
MSDRDDLLKELPLGIRIILTEAPNNTWFAAGFWGDRGRQSKIQPTTDAFVEAENAGWIEYRLPKIVGLPQYRLTDAGRFIRTQLLEDGLREAKYSVAQYERITGVTGLYPEGGTGSLIAINYCMLGLGEAGECQGKLKKVWRGDVTLDQQREKMLDEAGDILWYVTRLAIELGESLQGLIDRNGDKVLDRLERGVIKGDGDNR